MSFATSTDDGLQPWQFFVLAALACATVVTFLARGQGVTSVVLLTVLMGATALTGLATLGMIRPLVTTREERTAMIGERTRPALEREKMLALRAIKELEFDRAMGKVSEKDFAEMSARLRARAVGLMRQLDAGSAYRDEIEREIAKRVGPKSDKSGAGLHGPRGGGGPQGSAPHTIQMCPKCSQENDPDARFCKSCGSKLETAS
jgi:hypothetical protein